MWFRSKLKMGGRISTGVAVGALGLGIGAAVLLVRRLIKR